MVDHARLEAALAEFAQMLVDDEFSVADVLKRLCAHAVEILPIFGAGVSLRDEGEMRVMWASGPGAWELEDLQARLGEGPCEMALATGRTVEAQVDREGERWPAYIPEVARLGVQSIVAVPLEARGRIWGAVDAYCAVGDALDREDCEALKVLTDAAMAYVLTAWERRRRRAAEDELREQSLRDALTGLPNRTLLADRLRHALDGVGRRAGSVGVLFLDLDRFKLVNDTYGHAVGDELLISVARRLERLLRRSDTLGRLGGDELLVVCEQLHPDDGRLQRVGQRLLDALNEPFVLPQGEVLVRASIGAVLAVPDDTPEALLRDADMAMYAAKRLGGGTIVVSDRRTDEQMGEAVRTEPELQRALHLGELRLFFQPFMPLRPGGPEGYEALMRWYHPRRGLLAAGLFLPLAEENTLIVTLGRWAVAEACRRQQSLRPRGAHDDWGIAVNVSARQLQEPDLTDEVAEILASTGADPRHLVLEVTETTLIRRGDGGIETLRALAAMGIRVAIDDFGTGYSSLAYLTNLPAAILKIDKVFVDRLGHGRRDDVLVRGTIALAHELGLSVIAEGVETVSQHEFLLAAGCDAAQGYLYGRPEEQPQLPIWPV